MHYRPSTLRSNHTGSPSMHTRSAESSVSYDIQVRTATLPPIHTALAPFGSFLPLDQGNSFSNSAPALPPQPLTTGPTRVSSSRRRLSHSAIENRRRERINDKIDQLKHLIPSCWSTQLLPPASMHQPLHKLSVLQAAIEYIHQLHTELLEQKASSLQQQDPALAIIIDHAHRLQQLHQLR
ncbi:hypothetical protein [Absidia glauca]|uniref:BHLH domain-containing protein n=1 Tax=Absidia glauca TaxID=4829 RepID=A0A168P3X5_ABSGL|nr:hypothetical protein [Absidia glauca]